MTGTDILGYSACAVTALTFLPQVVKTWKEKSARNVSLMMFVIAAVNEAMWIAYGVLRNDMVIIVTNVIMIVMALTMISLKLRFSK
ncbi:MAG TPA: SemiSWEET transporter [Chitinophagaceae bacterium]